MRTAAILPVKRFSAAKQRLGAGVEEAAAGRARADDGRRRARGPRRHTRDRAHDHRHRPARAPALDAPGVTVVEDRLDEGQSAAASLGVERALQEGFERVLCVPGDCPALSPGGARRSCSARRARGGPEVVIVPDRHGSGTNGLLLAPPDAIAPSFGPGSFERHRSLVLAGGAALRVERPPSLLLDIDTDADLAGAAPSGSPTSSGGAPADARAARPTPAPTPAPDAPAPSPARAGRALARRCRPVRAQALAGLPEVRPGDDLAAADRRAARSRRSLRDGDGGRDRPQGRLQGRGRAGGARGRAARAPAPVELAADGGQGPAGGAGDPRRDRWSCCGPSAAC